VPGRMLVSVLFRGGVERVGVNPGVSANHVLQETAKYATTPPWKTPGRDVQQCRARVRSSTKARSGV